MELFREQARIIPGKYLGIVNGGFALRSVVRPLVPPEGGAPRVNFLTRLRHDAPLHAPPPSERLAGKRGRKPKWSPRPAPPRGAAGGGRSGASGPRSSTAGGG